MKRWAVSLAVCLLLAGCRLDPAPVRKQPAPVPGTSIERSEAGRDALGTEPGPLPQASAEHSALTPQAEQGKEQGSSMTNPPSPPASSSVPNAATGAGEPNKPSQKASERSVKTKKTPVGRESAKTPSVPVQRTETVRKRNMTLAELRAKYADFFKISGAGKEKKVALTFDDGPDARYTPQVLNVLKTYGVKATFFLMGSRAENHPDVVRRIVREGHAIGNHSYNHPLFPKLSLDQFGSQVERTGEVLSRLIGYKPKLIRPPYGEINEAQLQWAQSRRYLVVNWNVDSLDWKNLSDEEVARNILTHTKAGSIVLQHSAGGEGQDLSGTVKALPRIIEKLRTDGYEFVTVPELLHTGNGK